MIEEGKPGAIAKAIRGNPNIGQREIGELVWGLLPFKTERPENGAEADPRVLGDDSRAADDAERI